MRIFVLCLFLSMQLIASSYPNNWPWKGVNIELINNLPISEKEIQYLSDIGINTISVSIKTRQLSKQNHKDAFANLRLSFTHIHTLLRWCKKYELQLIITHSNFPIYPNNKSRRSSSEFWENRKNINEIIEVSKLISSEFKDYGHELGAYKIMAEPLIRDGNKVKTPEIWKNTIENIISIIRKNDKERYVYVTSGPGGSGNDFSSFKPLNDKYIIYGFHFYKPHAYTHQGIQGRKNDVTYPGSINLRIWDQQKLEQTMKPIINFKNKYQVPILVGEFSVVNGAKGELKYLSDALEIFEQHGFGWTYWCYNGYKGWNIHQERKDVYSPYIRVSDINSSRMKLLEKYLKGN